MSAVFSVIMNRGLSRRYNISKLSSLKKLQRLLYAAPSRQPGADLTLFSSGQFTIQRSVTTSTRRLCSPGRSTGERWRIAGGGGGGGERLKKERVFGDNDTSISTLLSIEVSPDRKSLVLLEGGNDKGMRFHSSWLRHNCQCETCKQPFSGQKLIDASLLQANYTVRSVSTLTEDVACVLWEEEEHVSIFPLSFLKDNEYSAETLERTRTAGRPSPCPERVPRMRREDLERTGGVLQWMRLINEFGICVLQDVPVRDAEVRRTAELIGPIQRTIYGDVWDVKSEPKPINVAYSDAQLDFHMDLAYYESPPGVQFLHCMKFDRFVEGGESVFVDAWYAAEVLRTTRPEEFDILTKVPATFQKIHFARDNPVHMRYRRPHIVLEPTGRIIAVNWAPAFEGPLSVPADRVDEYYSAYRTYAQLLQHSETKLRFRLEPGELVSFNNRRILHGREAFRLNGGERHLQGCYVNIDEFRSALEVAAKMAGVKLDVKHVMNQSWS